LLLLVGLFAENYDDFSDGLKALKRKRGTMASSETGSSASWPYEVLFLSQRLLHGSPLPKIMVSMYLMISLFGFFASRVVHPRYEYENVRFIRPIDGTGGYAWRIELDDGKGPFRVDFCSDYNVPALNTQPGEVARFLTYEDFGTCWSIKDKGLGTRMYRDENDWTIPTDVRRDFHSVLKEINDGKRTR